MATVRSIAAEAGVSPATVSRVLNNDPRVSVTLRERVKAVARAKQTPPAVDAMSQTLGVVYTGRASIGSPFDSALIDGFATNLGHEALDLRVLSASTFLAAGGSIRAAIESKHLSGLIIRTTSETRDIAVDIFEMGVPAVVVCDRIDHPDASYIVGNSRQGVHEAVDHLVSIGHERITLVNSLIDDRDHRERDRGFQDALASAGHDFDRSQMIRVWPHRRGGASAMNRIMAERDRPTAVFFTDMGAALGAAKRAFELGVRIPGDMSMASFDDTDLRFFTCPTMTAVCQDTVQIGRSAFQMLQSLIRDPSSGPLRQEVPHWLEVHQSTGTPDED
ncbi:MAG: LacI family DNA-binding transcriptional regulator [Planctomycetota bacterium]